MSTWPSALITGLTGLVGVITGGFLQARVAREQERRNRLYEPAADLSAKLRGAATSVDHLIRPLVGEARNPAEADAYGKAAHLVEEAFARRAGTEFAFPSGSRVYEAATAAAEKLRAALEAVKPAANNGADEQTKATLVAARTAYEDAIREFNKAARDALSSRRKVWQRTTS
jgi:predicted lipid-binding transport protein (Tim44 family)